MFYFECLRSILHHTDMCCRQCQMWCQGCPQLPSVLTRRGLCSASHTQAKVPLKLVQVLSLNLLETKLAKCKGKPTFFSWLCRQNEVCLIILICILQLYQNLSFLGETHSASSKITFLHVSWKFQVLFK